MQQENLLETFSVNELEERTEFSLFGCIDTRECDGADEGGASTVQLCP